MQVDASKMKDRFSEYGCNDLLVIPVLSAGMFYWFLRNLICFVVGTEGLNQRQAHTLKWYAVPLQSNIVAGKEGCSAFKYGCGISVVPIHTYDSVTPGTIEIGPALPVVTISVVEGPL